MVDEATLKEETPEQAEPAKKKKGKLPLVLTLLVLLGGGGAGGWYFFAGQTGVEVGDAAAETQETRADAVYFTLAENLVVNFQSPGGTRFLQVGVDLMTYDADGVHALEQHTPVLKSNLILLLSDQTQEKLSSREGKEQLRADALSEVRAAMKKLHGSPIAESLYFTSFVMQ
jgi:flagellar FliL protein